MDDRDNGIRRTEADFPAPLAHRGERLATACALIVRPADHDLVLDVGKGRQELADGQDVWKLYQIVQGPVHSAAPQ